MATTMTRQEHLESVAEEAMAYFDQEDQAGAIACVASRFKDHPATAGYAEDGFLMMMVLSTGWEMGRQGFKKAITDFAV